jgi:hypothetical protein
MWGRRGRGHLVDTEEMVSFYEQLDHLNEAQLMGLRAAWQSTSREDHEVAWTTVRAIGAREGLSKEIDRVRNRALAWASRGSNSVPYRHHDDATWLQLKIEAGEAIVDAALAVALGDRLDADSRGTLIEPWLRATGAQS